MDEEDKVGYKHPPKEHQFKRGFSGNMRGRPVRQHSFEDFVLKELKKKTQIKESGETKTITWLEAIVKTLVNKAIMNSQQALEIIQQHPAAFTEVINVELKLGERTLNPRPLTPEEEAALQAICDRRDISRSS